MFLKKNSIKKRYYILPTVFIILLFISNAYMITTRIERYIMGQMIEESNRMANNLSSLITISNQTNANIDDLRDRLEVQPLIDSLLDKDFDNDIDLFFIDRDFNVLASTKDTLIGEKRPLDEDALGKIREYGYYGEIKSSHIKFYEIIIPLDVRDKNVGYLSIRHSLEDIRVLIMKLSFIGLFALLILYSLIILIIYSIQKKNKELEYIAYHDKLTSLPNKEFLFEYMEGLLKNKKSQKMALILINCKNFSSVNMTFGYQSGDEIIRELGSKLSALQSDKIILFRFSEARFVFLVKDYMDKDDLKAFSNKVLDIFKRPFNTTYIHKYISGNIGIVEVKDDNSLDNIFKQLEIASNNSKERSMDKVAFFNRDMEEKIVFHEKIEEILREVVESNNGDNSFYLEFQPQLDIKRNKLVGFEALARLNSKDLGPVSPMDFIAVAEKRNLIVPLGKIILLEAFKFLASIRDKNIKDMRVAVNASVIELLDDQYIDYIFKLRDDFKVDLRNLEIEITESIFMGNYQSINERLNTLRKEGVKIALDDFGTGYSSLSRISRINFDYIKIDKSFIDNILDIKEEEILVNGIIKLAGEIGLKVIAEGVESMDQYDYLKDINCNIIQGYYFSKPLAAEEAVKLI